MKRALVTGGNRGIGLAIAQALAADGMEVVIGARDAASVPDLGFEVLQLDVAKAADIAAVPDNFDVLVNNAGVLWHDEQVFDDPAHFQASLDVMVTGPYLMMRQVLPGMQARGFGRIVNVSSQWGSFAEGIGGGGAYGMAKAALNGLTVLADRDTGPEIKVNAMCPGWVKTRMGGEAATRTPELAAKTALWLATLPEDGPSGGFFRDCETFNW